MDIYRDYFTRENLLASILKAPYVPGMLGELGLFTTIGLTSTTLSVEEPAMETPALLTATPRGTPSKVETLGKAKVHTFQTAHYRVDGAVYADEVLNARGLGVSGAAAVIADRRDRLVAKQRLEIDLILENLRLSCLNAPSNTIGNAPASAAVAFGSSDSAIRSAIFNNVVKPMETALGGVPHTGLLALCDDTFWAGLIESKTIQSTYLNQVQAAQLRGVTTEQVVFGGVTWARYRGTGSTVIASGKAKVVPLGVPELFIQAFAPADTLDAVGAGAMGTPYYPMALPSDDQRMWKLEMQTNPVTVCTRPAAVLTIGLS